jgi:hypothetical protein
VGLAVPDHKFDRKYDRHAIPLDFKERILDFMDFSATPPETGIYDEPVRYFKANLEWCKFIFGFLAWAENVAYWQEADDELHHAIQQILIFEEGIEAGILMDPEIFETRLHSAMYRVFNDVAKQIVSGVTAGFSVDEDGNVVPPGAATDPKTPEDDPATPAIDENSEYRAGVAIAFKDMVNSLFAKLDDLFGSGPTPDTPLEDAIYIINKTYYTDAAAMESAITAYYNRRGLGDPIFTTLGEGLAEFLFCNNLDDDKISQYILDELSGDLPKKQNAIDLVDALHDDEFISARSEVEPSTDYRAYACVPIPTEEFTLDMSTGNVVSYTTNGVWKGGHRYLIEITGSYTDSDLPDVVGDGMYFHNTSTGIKTFSNLGLDFNGTITVPTQAQVPFSPSHAYRYTVDRTGGSNAARTITRDNGLMATPNVTGVLTIKVTDLGQYT